MLSLLTDIIIKMNFFKITRIQLGLGLIFILALTLRFLYFPNNVYFGFDQARDAFASQEIMRGNLRLVGPPTSGNLFHHGVLYYYIFGPIYTLFNGNPEAVSAFLRIFNSLGVFIIFIITVVIFNPTAAIFASLLFAFSYEQTQFSLFLNHPSLAVISVLIFYLGLSLWIFRKEKRGLFISLFGLALSIQFEFVELQLIPIFLLFLIYFRKELPSFINPRNIFLAFLIFIIPVSTYLLTEIKNDFYILRHLPLFFTGENSIGGVTIFPLKLQLVIADRFIQDNLISFYPISVLIALILLVMMFKYLKDKIFKDKIVFLSFWFFGGLLIYFITSDDAYFYNTGTSISLLIFASFLLSRLYQKNKYLALTLLIFIIISNLYLITKNNPSGPNQKINPQRGLVLSSEREVLDFIYRKAEGKEFAVNALTMPLNINTTWSYLFEWYGQKKYGYLPVWGGDAAEGYYGNLKVNKARSTLPEKRFLIIEPKDGIHSYLIDQFIANENIFTEAIEKKKIGALEVWIQKLR